LDNNAIKPGTYAPAVVLTRGDIVESLHRAAVAVVDAGGTLLASLGSAETVTYLRSTAKPLQAITLVENGGMGHFGFSHRELSLMCASHCGTDRHASVAASIQEKAGVKETDLLCGVHPPLDKETAEEMILRGEKSTPNRHQCSGKHSGMMANCKLHGFPIEKYIDLKHPLQQMVMRTNAEMWDVVPDSIRVGVDGCSVPVFAIALKNAALGFARLVDPEDLSPGRASACRQIAQAMIEYPEMVAGNGRFDTELMRVGGGKLIAKMGAEGFQSVGVFPGVSHLSSRGIGVAVKVEDGDLRGETAALIALEALRQMDAISSQELDELKPFTSRPIYNWRKMEIGRIKTIFALEFWRS